MTKSFTQNDLIRYIYQEMSASESVELVQALQVDAVLMQEYLDLLCSVEHLDKLIREPSHQLVARIKDLARSTQGVEKV
ncbi:hypothetical protein ADIS_3926 [Lunatimonas lonarensis]|uniref:Uncharacterized protein n=1 Tax=Lunatimonas lonarensis TaxID=1232681 RepID=R7ZN67_9BACT|nr:hypothetical protein [Lunatimonas lonarensis]EON75523.1 hypothetical protein ADIS_3926 [Lunatimonas lonarensis]